MPDETAPGNSPKELQLELDRSRESSARLLDSFARKIGGNRAVRKTASSVNRAAHYVHAHSAKDVAIEIERFVRRRPGYSIAAAVVAGFLVGRALRSR